MSVTNPFAFSGRSSALGLLKKGGGTKKGGEFSRLVGRDILSVEGPVFTAPTTFARQESKKIVEAQSKSNGEESDTQ